METFSRFSHDCVCVAGGGVPPSGSSRLHFMLVCVYTMNSIKCDTSLFGESNKFEKNIVNSLKPTSLAHSLCDDAFRTYICGMHQYLSLTSTVYHVVTIPSYNDDDDNWGLYVPASPSSGRRSIFFHNITK